MIRRILGRLLAFGSLFYASETLALGVFGETFWLSPMTTLTLCSLPVPQRNDAQGLQTEPLVMATGQEPIEASFSMTDTRLPGMKIVGILRKGAILEADQIPGGVGPKGIAWRASSSGSPGAFHSHSSLE